MVSKKRQIVILLRNAAIESEGAAEEIREVRTKAFCEMLTDLDAIKRRVQNVAEAISEAEDIAKTGSQGQARSVSRNEPPTRGHAGRG